MNRGRHLCSAGRPSRWALAHILVFVIFHSIPQKPLWTELYQIWHTDVITCDNFLAVGLGMSILCGSKFTLSHWQGQLPLTRGWCYCAAHAEWSFAGISSVYVTSHLGQLSLLPSLEWEMSTGQTAVMLCDCKVKTGVAYFIMESSRNDMRSGDSNYFCY